MQWQPIETAPKDARSEILVFLNDELMGPCYRVVFSSVTNEWSDGVDIYEPTHWMPLPPPPLAV